MSFFFFSKLSSIGLTGSNGVHGYNLLVETKIALNFFLILSMQLLQSKGPPKHSKN